MGNKSKKPVEDKQSSEFEEDEEFERPDWDDEEYRSKSETEGDEEFERPDWDDEVWFKKLKRLLVRGPGPYLAVFALVLVVVLALPSGRAGVLNKVGARGQVSFHVYDRETNDPLRNVTVTLGTNASKTNETGMVTFEGVKLGRQQLVIEKSAYESYSQIINVGWGDNEVGDVSIEPVGKRFNFKIVDWLSLEPIGGAEAAYQDSIDTANSEGLATLNVIKAEGLMEFTFSADEYVTFSQNIDPGVEGTVEIKLVALGKHHYVSTAESEDRGIYEIAADGNASERISSEVPTIFTVSPNRQIGILVNNNGDEAELKFLNLGSGETGEIDSSPRIDLIGWIGDSIIYLKLKAGAKPDAPDRHTIMAYDTDTGLSKQLAAANLFNDILVAESYVFYAPSSLNLEEGAQASLFRVRIDGSNKTTITDKETRAIVRDNPQTIRYNADNEWYQTGLDTIEQTPVESEGQTVSKLYVDNPFNSQLSVWVDMDGDKPALKLINEATGVETEVTSRPGLRNPLRWLSSQHLVFRVKTQDAASDYIININGGESVKLTDVEDIPGVESWLFYFE